MSRRSKKEKRMPKHAKPIPPPKELKPIRWGLYFIIVVIVLIIAIGLISWDNFTIHKIDVVGLDKIQYLDVIQLTGIEYMKNIFTINLQDVESKITQNPILEVISIQRKLPSTIEITVHERNPIALIESLDKYIIINNECIALGVVEPLIEKQYILIDGVTLTSYQLGQSIHLQSTIQVDKLNKILTALEEIDAHQLIQKIDINLTENIILNTHAGFEVHLGSIENIEKKCIWLKTMVSTLVEKGETKGTLYITNVDSAHFIASENQ
ncbi:MAG: FtsQ-type POTRA domain-containing protein [Clostridiales bacterium]|nr:FtsQ-type POTRA domain-containing protein [Clostridiales bacterium]